MLISYISLFELFCQKFIDRVITEGYGDSSVALSDVEKQGKQTKLISGVLFFIELKVLDSQIALVFLKKQSKRSNKMSKNLGCRIAEDSVMH